MAKECAWREEKIFHGFFQATKEKRKILWSDVFGANIQRCSKNSWICFCNVGLCQQKIIAKKSVIINFTSNNNNNKKNGPFPRKRERVKKRRLKARDFVQDAFSASFTFFRLFQFLSVYGQSPSAKPDFFLSNPHHRFSNGVFFSFASVKMHVWI